MKNILVYTRSLRVGGITTVLYHYLNLLSQNPEYKIDLLLIEEPNHAQVEPLPNNITRTFILSDVEAEFNIYLHWKEKDHYVTSWIDGIKQRIRYRTLNYINARPPYDIIINFNGDFDSFLNYYDLHSHTKIFRLVHIENDIRHFANDFAYTKNIFSKQHAFVAIANDMQEKLDALINGKGEKSFNLNKPVKMIYNPVPKTSIQQRMQEPCDLDDSGYLLSVAGLYDYKNHKQMIDIYHQLKQKGIKEKLYIIGDGASRQQLQDKIAALGLTNDCLLLGAKNNPIPYMKAAKLFIHTANFEGFGMALAESMTTGTPVVAFDCPTGPREILADGKYGGLIPMGDNDKFVETVYDLLTNESKRQAYIDLLPESVERFGLETIGHEFKKLLDVLTHKEAA